MIQAALHEVQGSLRQSRVAAPKLDFAFLDVPVLLPAELCVERAVGAQPWRERTKSVELYRRWLRIPARPQLESPNVELVPLT